MKEHESSFSPEAIDALTRRDPGKQLLPDEQRLIQDVYSLSQEYARKNERSLERIWNRLAQGQEQPVLLQKQEPGATGLFMEGKAMEPKDVYQDLLQERRQQGTYEEKEFSTLDSQPVKRSGRSRWRTVGLSAAAAVVALTILSWALLSAGLRHGPQNTNVAVNHQVNQASISTGTLLCSFADNNSKVYLAQSSLDWSANGQIAATYSNLQTFSAQNCAQGSPSIPGSLSAAIWSPDGKRLLVLKDGVTAQVLDASTGNVISNFPPVQGSTGTTSAQSQTTGVSPMSSFSGGPNNGGSPTELVDQSVWSADGTQVISVTSKYDSQTKNNVTRVVVWNASTGAVVRVAMTLDPNLTLIGLNSGVDQNAISPNGKYLAAQTTNHSIEIWNIATGQRVSTLPFNPSVTGDNSPLPSAVAWSPDGASIALGLPNASDVQIYSVTSGQLIITFRDRDAVLHGIGSLAWSPDGKYLAESGSDIHLWDVSAQKIVATFGKVDQKYWIATLAWSPDSKMLVSTYNANISVDKADRYLNTGNIWKLS